MPAFITESEVERSALGYLSDLGYEVLYGQDIDPEKPAQERQDFGQVVLAWRLRSALGKLNPQADGEALDDAMRQILRVDSPSLVENNHSFHRMVTDGVSVPCRKADGTQGYQQLRLLDHDDPKANDFLAVNQFTVLEDKHHRRPDIVIFLNGLPVAVFEMKNPADEKATAKSAFKQLQTYKKQIPTLFQFNELLIVSDGLTTKVGSLTANWEWFLPWRTADGETVAPKTELQLRTLVQGAFDKSRLLDLIRYFVVFDTSGAAAVKKIAAYHQFGAVNKAVECTVKASRPEGDRRAGVVWHTQGSGKSLSMAFYAGKMVQHPAMENPTIVVLTDRNDLDDQLFGTFSACQGLLRQAPTQAQSRDHLRELLKVGSGGVVFTTIQKFFAGKGEQHPQLSDRRNIVVIADEAHRSQYDFIRGLAKHMRQALPYASFIGFTGTPIELADKSTPAVFGSYIDIYDVARAVEDGATVPIYYEARLAKIELPENERPKVDEDFEEVTEDQEETERERLKTKWKQLEAVVGTEKRLRLIAADIVEHFENRLGAIDGKGMIVCMSRRICVDLYKYLVELRPEWGSEEDEAGTLKVVMTGNPSEELAWQQHIRNKPRREALARRFKDPKDPFKLVIVRDMWLTGFDCPSLHTMYVDKPMQGHALMQAIARVNRVFRDKQGGLVVDYLGLAAQLKKALAAYSDSDRQEAGVDLDLAARVLREKYEVVVDMWHGFDYSDCLSGTGQIRLEALPGALEHILQLEDGKKRYLEAVTALSRAFALAVPHDYALSIRDEVGLFQAIRAGLAKGEDDENGDGGERQASPEDVELAVRQIVSQAVSADQVVDIFSIAGLDKPDISVLSEEFLEEVRGIKQKNLAVEALRRLIEDTIKTRGRTNVVESRKFSEILVDTIKRYQNRTIEAAAVIEALIQLAKDMRDAQKRGESLGLSEEEVAFYDALETNDSAVAVLGDDTLRAIARELVEAVRKNASIDWTVRESTRAKLRVIVRRTLKRFGYPPDKQEKATQTVLEQAEQLCREWAG
ncbi:MAG: type I restriction endonuclease subunit R [Armatimonadia bacterium]